MRQRGNRLGYLGIVLLLTSLPGLAVAQATPREIELRDIPEDSYKITLVQLPTGKYALVLEPSGGPRVRIFGGWRRVLVETKTWAVNSIRTDVGSFFVGLVLGTLGSPAVFVLYPSNVTPLIHGNSATRITLVFHDSEAREGAG